MTLRFGAGATSGRRCPLRYTHEMSGKSYPVEFERALAALDESGIRFVVVGGVAVVIHGVDRLTADLDVVMDLDSSACSRALGKLAAVGYQPRAPVNMIDFAQPDVRKSWREQKRMMVFSLWDPSNELPPLDIFTDYPLEFEAMLRDSEFVDLGSVRVRVASKRHLIYMKAGTGRTKDQQDIRALQDDES